VSGARLVIEDMGAVLERLTAQVNALDGASGPDVLSGLLAVAVQAGELRDQAAALYDDLIRDPEWEG
jgi:hypothetical protein